MKYFFINIFVVLGVSGILLILVSLYDIKRLHKADFNLGEDVHIIAYGPSTFSYGLKDDLIPGFKNMARDGSANNLLMPLLPKILEENPQIDTIWINHGRFQFFHMAGPSVNSGFQKIRRNLPLLLYDYKFIQWVDLLKNIDFYGAMLNPDVYNFLVFDRKTFTGYDFEGYKHSDYHHLKEPGMLWGIEWYDNEMKAHGGNYYSKEWIYEKCRMNHEMMIYGLEVCKSHGVVPILFFSPLYQFDRWCSRDGFCDYMKDFDSKLLVADYEDFEFPDDSYYQDVHHLNSKGAEYFTNYIAKHGLNTVSLGEWLQAKAIQSHYE